MTETFDATKEPLRAFRDLVAACEGIFGTDWPEEVAVLERAQTALATLRARYGDARPNEDVAFGPLIEPPTLRVASDEGAQALYVALEDVCDGHPALDVVTATHSVMACAIAAIHPQLDKAIDGVNRVAADMESLLRKKLGGTGDSSTTPVS
jgi:hypothetical protein